MSELTTLARPYAKAAFEYALENNNLSEWSDMLKFLSLVISDETMSNLLDNPALTHKQAAEAVLAVAEGKIDQKCSNFVQLLASNGRLELMTEILSLFEQHKAEHDKTVDVELRSAVELSEQQLKDLNGRLETKLGRKVNINCQTDESVMGGMIIRAGDFVIDASVRGQLNDLADSLAV